MQPGKHAAPAASIPTTPLPGPDPRRTYGRDHLGREEDGTALGGGCTGNAPLACPGISPARPGMHPGLTPAPAAARSPALTAPAPSPPSRSHRAARADQPGTRTRPARSPQPGQLHVPVPYTWRALLMYFRCTRGTTARPGLRQFARQTEGSAPPPTPEWAYPGSHGPPGGPADSAAPRASANPVGRSQTAPGPATLCFYA